PFLYASIITGLATISLMTFVESVKLGATASQSSYPLNSENASPFGTFTVYLSWAARANAPRTERNAPAIIAARIRRCFISSPLCLDVVWLSLIARGVPPRRLELLHGEDDAKPRFTAHHPRVGLSGSFQR